MRVPIPDGGARVLGPGPLIPEAAGPTICPGVNAGGSGFSGRGFSLRLKPSSELRKTDAI